MHAHTPYSNRRPVFTEGFTVTPRELAAIEATSNSSRDKLGKKEVLCPSNVITSRCRRDAPFICLEGSDRGKCGATTQLMDNIPACTSYCNVTKATRSMVQADLERKADRINSLTTLTAPDIEAWAKALPPRPFTLPPSMRGPLHTAAQTINPTITRPMPVVAQTAQTARPDVLPMGWPIREPMTNLTQTNYQPAPTPRPDTAIGSNKFVRCPMDLQSSCTAANPFQCIEGRATGQCALNPKTWETSDDCQAYCTMRAGSDYDIKPRAERTIRLTNKCPNRIHIGTSGQPNPSLDRGSILDPGTQTDIRVPGNWTDGQIWARTGCRRDNTGQLICDAGNCNAEVCTSSPTGPVTVAQFDLSNDPSIPDQYRINLSKGFNVPVRIQPTPHTFHHARELGLGNFNCGIAGCRSFDMAVCPPELLVKGHDGQTYCSSVCAATRNPTTLEAVAKLAHINPDMVCCDCVCGDPNCKFGCNPFDSKLQNSCNPYAWPRASDGRTYTSIFKDQCPNAAAWPYDLASSTYRCGNADYEVQFC